MESSCCGLARALPCCLHPWQRGGHELQYQEVKCRHGILQQQCALVFPRAIEVGAVEWGLCPVPFSCVAICPDTSSIQDSPGPTYS